MAKSKNVAEKNAEEIEPTDGLPNTAVGANDQGKLTSVTHFFCNKIQSMRNCDLRRSDIQIFFKVLRKKIGLAKTPKKKGYGRFLTDEEKRYS